MSKHLEKEFINYQNNVISKKAGDIQIKESRRAFYAGAACMFAIIQSFLTGGTEPTIEELQKVDQLLAELKNFANLVVEGLR